MNYDTGFLEGPNGRFEVRNVQVYGGFVLHMGSFTRQSDKFSVGGKVVCKVLFLIYALLYDCCRLTMTGENSLRQTTLVPTC